MDLVIGSCDYWCIDHVCVVLAYFLDFCLMSFSATKVFGPNTYSAARIGKWVPATASKETTTGNTSTNKRLTGGLLNTPASLMYTRCGHVPYLSEDVVQLHMGDRVLSKHRLLCMSTVLNMSQQISKSGNSRNFLGLDDDAIVFVSQFDPTEQRLMGADTNTSAAFPHRGGRRSLEPSDYVEFIQSLQPDFAPFMVSTPNSLSTASAIRRTVKRSASHANTCYELNDYQALVCPSERAADYESETQRPPATCAGSHQLMSERNPPGDTFMMNGVPPISSHNITPKQASPVLGVLGTENPEDEKTENNGKKQDETKKECTEIENKGKVYSGDPLIIMGPSIDCSFSNEHISMQINELGSEMLSSSQVIYFYSNPDLLPAYQFANIAQQLPQSALKVLIGASRPDFLLDALSCGFDVFDNAFCYSLTERKLAFIFDFENTDLPERGNYLLCNNKVTILDCSELQFREDFSPILKKCDCYTCKTYTKAYLNHLIVTRELLAPILLNIHNLYWYDKFFNKVLKLMKDGDSVNFESLRSKIRSSNFNF